MATEIQLNGDVSRPLPLFFPVGQITQFFTK